jgi:hypothetical protein
MVVLNVFRIVIGVPGFSPYPICQFVTGEPPSPFPLNTACTEVDVIEEKTTPPGAGGTVDRLRKTVKFVGPPKP